MKLKNVNLEWYAFRYEWNEHKLVFVNVLQGWEEDIYKKVKKGAKDKWKPVTDYTSFKEWLRGEFMYYYWSKAEHECLIGDLFSSGYNCEDYPHFKIKTADGIELDLIETKHYLELQKKQEKVEKHDIYWQLEPNLDRICEYIITEMKIEWK